MKPKFSGLERSLAARALALVVTTSCSSRTEPAPLRIAINPWPGYEFLYLAAVKGFDKEEGVPLRLLEMGSLGDARRSFERGQADGLACTLIEVVQVRDRTARSPVACLVADFSKGADVVIAPAGTRSLADLRGKRVGCEVGSASLFLLCRGLELSKMSLSDITIVPRDQSQMGDAYRAGEIDAFVSYPPVAVTVLAEGKSAVVFSSSEIPGEIVDVVALDRAVIDRDPTIPARLRRTFDRAMQYAKEFPDDAYALMAGRERIGVEEFRKALDDGVALVSADEQDQLLAPGGTVERALRFVIDTLRATGQLQGADRSRGSILYSSRDVGRR